eukprot:5473765-Ditylum_brightwellii.AAC.1
MVLINPDQFILEDGVKSSKIISSEFTRKAKVHGRIITSVVVSATKISWAGSSRSTSELEVYAEDVVLLNPDTQITVDENGKETMILYLSRYQKCFASTKNVNLPYHHIGRDMLCSNALSKHVFSSKSFNAAQHASTVMVECSIPKYDKVFSTKDMHYHVTHHIIHNPTLASKLGIDFSPLLLCDMCGSHWALAYTADSSVDR